MQKKTFVNVEIAPTLNRQLKVAAGLSGASRAMLVRAALRDYLERKYPNLDRLMATVPEARNDQN